MITIVWDVDDVLNDLMRCWFTVDWLPSHPECRLRYEDLAENPPDAVLGISRAEYLASLDIFRLSSRAEAMQPNPDFLRWFREEGRACRHVALTSRPALTVPPLAAWVFRHFGAWVRTFSYVPSRPEEGAPVYDRSKGEFLAWLDRASVLVDDAPENVDSALALGMKGILVPQPWNACRRTVAETLDSISAAVQDSDRMGNRSRGLSQFSRQRRENGTVPFGP